MSDICKIRCDSPRACGLMYLYCNGTCYIDCDETNGFECPLIFGSNYHEWNTNEPTQMPTMIPSNIPSDNPTINPTNKPTILPTTFPSFHPSMLPTNNPTLIPSNYPSNNPSINPTIFPTIIPSFDPTIVPTHFPIKIPSNNPSAEPTMNIFEPSKTSNLTQIPTSSPISNSINDTSFKTTMEIIDATLNIVSTFDTAAGEESKGKTSSSDEKGLSEPAILAIVICIVLCLLCALVLVLLFLRDQSKDKKEIEMERLRTISLHTNINNQKQNGSNGEIKYKDNYDISEANVYTTNGGGRRKDNYNSKASAMNDVAVSEMILEPRKVTSQGPNELKINPNALQLQHTNDTTGELEGTAGGMTVVFDENDYLSWTQQAVMNWLQQNLETNMFDKDVIEQFLDEFKQKCITGKLLDEFKKDPKLLDEFKQEFSDVNRNYGIWMAIRTMILSLGK